MMWNKRLSWFFGAVALQVLVVAGVPAPKAYTMLTGRTILLKTAPVDPYSIMSGYYVTLGYDISRLEKTPGWSDTEEENETVYVVLKEGEDGCWHAESVHDRWPAVPQEGMVIKGRRHWGGVTYGIESYYVPETARQTIEKDLRANQSRGRVENGHWVELTEAERQALDPIRVEVKVDRFGHAAVVRLLIGDRVYDY